MLVYTFASFPHVSLDVASVVLKSDFIESGGMDLQQVFTYYLI